MNETSLERWLQRIETIHPEEIELGLGRVSEVANRLQLLPVAQPVVTVGGTNGKGSTVAVLEALLGEAGYSTGAFTSPHLVCFNERIRVAGVDVTDTEIVDAFVAIEEARGPLSLTYFEFATLAALVIFKARNPDILILEVGLGGRLDAVNMVDPSVTVITSIDLDHQDWLGESRGEIAREKAGILRRGRPVVIAEPDPPSELQHCVAEVAASPALYLGRDFTVLTEQNVWRAVLQRADGSPWNLVPQAAGPLLPENICAAAQAALLLDIDITDDNLAQALPKVALAGRRQLRQVAGRDYILDVAHNPASVDKLLEYLGVTPCKGRTFALFSIMSDKDIGSIVAAASRHFDGWFLADQPGNKRAARAVDIAALLSAAGESMITVGNNLQEALQSALCKLQEGDRLVVFGSFYTVAGILPLLDGDDDKNEVR